MSHWLPIVLSIVIPLLSVVVNAVINLTIKFAPSKDAATQELKALGLRVILITLQILTLASTGFNIYMLYSTIISSDPLTRGAVFTITLQVATLMFVITMYIINIVAGRIKQLYETTNRLTDTVSNLTDTQNSHILLTKNNTDIFVKHLEENH